MARDRRRPRARGQVLIITLISISLLVGLVFYVLNVGDQVNRRLEMQAAADAVAVSGAGWMARNMNIIAMDNVAEVKMLSLVPLLDAQPLATEMALTETTSWWEGLRDQVNRGITESPPAGQMLLEGLTTLRDRMWEQAEILRPYNDMLNGSAQGGAGGGFDMESVTTWQAKGGAGVPSGTLWQAALALEDFSRAAWESAGLLAQERAGRIGGTGDDDEQSNRADVSFLVPIVPELPAVEGTFLHFRPTLRNRLRVTSVQATIEDSRAGGAIPDFAWPHRLGPWARLHRWRDYMLGDFIPTGEPTYVPGTGGRVRGGGGNVNVSGRSVGQSAQGGGNGGHWNTPGYREQIGYTTFGLFSWARRDLSWWANGTNEAPGKLRDTFYYKYVRDLSNTKLDYMFPADGGMGAGAATQTQLYHYPQWITDYPACVTRAADGSVRVTSTLFYKLEIASKYPQGDGMFMTPGTFRTNGEYPIAFWANGWQDPDKWGIPKVDDYVWKDEYTYETTADPQIGIYPLTNPPGDPNGEEVWQPVYMVVWYVFGGIDVGGDVEIVNPCNWDDPGMLPVPFLLDTSQGDYEDDNPDLGYRRERFMYLGVVRKDTAAPVWPSRFYDASKLQAMITVAQAKVFNNKSFDLWTQDWRAHLAPVTGWQDWMGKMAAGAAGASNVTTVSAEDILTIHEYLSALDPDLAAVYMNH